MGQCTRLWYLSHQRAVKAWVSLHIWADSPEPSLLVYTKYGCRRMLRLKGESLTLLTQILVVQNRSRTFGF